MDTPRKKKSDPKFPHVTQELKRPTDVTGPPWACRLCGHSIELRLSRGLPDTLAPRDPWPRLV